MSIDRRKPFARLQPNDSKPADAAPSTATATARLTISRPRRQMPAHHYQHQHQHPQNSQKRYATMIPGSSRSSATSSAESLYSNTAGSSLVPRRRRKLSAAEDVAARVRARWAALEALERAGASSSSSRSGGVSTAGYLHSAPAPAQRRRSLSANNAEKENAVLSMQVDAYEKPLPPHPPPPALTPLHISAPIPIPATTATAAGYSASADGHTVVAAATTTTTTTTVMMDTRLDDCAPMSAPATAAVTGPAPGPGESTVRTTPTSLTFVETDSSSPGAGLGPALQRRPTRAVTPPQVRRRASITDELEEAVSPALSNALI